MRWDPLCRQLLVRDAPESSNIDEFKQIVAAVAREYGVKRLNTAPSFADRAGEYEHPQIRLRSYAGSDCKLAVPA